MSRTLFSEVDEVANKCAAVAVAVFVVLPLLAGCSLTLSAGHADLAPTLSFQDEPGGPVAFQSAQPLPTFDRQPRLSIQLDGTRRYDPEHLGTGLSLTDREASLEAITTELGHRAEALYDASGWAAMSVPGTFNPPPDRTTTGGFYRLDFFVPDEWSGRYAMLKFGAV